MGRSVGRAGPARGAEPLEPRVLMAVTPIAIVNPSFEEAAGPDDNSAVAVVGWDTKSAGNAFNPNSIAYVDASDNSQTGGVLPTPGDGKQALFLNSTRGGPSTASQTLTATLAAFTTYELTVAVGNRADLLMDNYRIALFAGSTQIAATTGDGEAAPSGGFGNFTVTADPVSGTSPLVGQPLRVELTHLATKTDGAVQVNFDNVLLNAITSDPTAPTATVTNVVAVAGAATIAVTVEYQASAGAPMDASTVSASNLRLAGPNNYNQLATSVGNPTQTGGGAIVTATYSFPAPGGTLDVADNGDYQAVAQPNGVRDANENFVPAGPFGTFPVAVVPQPVLADLAFAAAATVSAGTYSPGDLVPVNLVPVNLGAATAATTAQVDVVLSADAAFSADDVLLLTVPAAQLGTALPPVGPIPSSTAAGDYFVIARVDPKGVVTESDETNNAFVSPTAAVTVAPSKPAEPSLAIGGLDPTFGTNGTVRPSLGFETTAGARQQPDGKLVVGGTRGDPGSRQVGFARLDRFGGPDPSFGDGTGPVFTDVRGTDNYLVDFDLVAGGKILAVGVSSESAGGATVGSDFFVARFNPDGSLDPAFGTNGRTIVDFAAAAAGARSTDVARDLLVLADGRIVVVGRTTAAAAGGGGGTNFAVARLTADGALDPSFGGLAAGGKVVTDFANGDDAAQAVAADAAGGLIVAGYAAQGAARWMAVARYLPDGTLDARFGTNGRVAFSSGGQDERANAVAVAANGSIVLAGATATGSAAAGTFDSDCVAARLSSRGKLDRKFGVGGTSVAGFGQPASPSDLRVGADGRVLVSCVTSAAVASGQAGRTDLALLRYAANGALDPSFGGGDGKVIIPTDGSVSTTATDVARTPALRAAGTVVMLAAGDTAAADALDAFQNSVEGKLTDREGGGAFLAGTNGTQTVIAALVTSGVELSGALTVKAPAAVIGGAKGSASVAVANLGDVLASGLMDITLYASADAELGSGDRAFLTLAGRPLKLKPLADRGKPKAFKLKFTFPTDLPDGTYYLLADVNASGSIAELDPNNNAAATASPVTITAPFVDLKGPPLAGATPLSLAKASPVRLTLENGGNIAFKGSVGLAVILSADSTLDAGDTTLPAVTTKASLAAGKGKALTVKVGPPTGLAAGNYFVFVRIDPASAVAEKDETNNLLSSTLASPLG